MKTKEAEPNMRDVAISVAGVSKAFMLPHEKKPSIKSLFVSMFHAKRFYERQQVLKNISFEVKKGDFFGIVGRNGSGKSTLLKLLAGIYTPDEGQIQINGKLTPFIELGVGFNPELTGKENVFLNGALLGFNREEMAAMYEEIVEFAELEKFMDQKLKNYSSGMQVRLAFSIAIRANTDILVLDEVLAVGDESFQRKCNDYFAKIRKDKNKTIILVTHSMGALQKYCNKAIMLRNGEILASGNPEDVSNEYSIENLTTGRASAKETENNSIIQDLRVEAGPRGLIRQNTEVTVRISYRVKTKIPTRVKLSAHDIDRNMPLFASDSPLIQDEKVCVILRTKLSSINDTNLKISVSIRNEKFEVLDFMPEKKSPVLSLKRTDYPPDSRKTTWAVLFNRGDWEIQ